MDPFLAYVLLVSVGVGLHSAWDHARKDYKSKKAAAMKGAEKKSAAPLTDSMRMKVRRDHRRAWWAAEAGHGFPVTRTGWHTGRLAHQTTLMHTRAIREEARTQSLEVQASHIPGMADHKRRQEALRAEIEAALAADPVPGKVSRKAVREHLADVLPFPARPAPPEPPAEPGQPEGSQKAPPGPYAKPETAGSLLFGPEEDHVPATCPIAGCACKRQPSTEGTPPMTAEATYTSVVTSARSYALQAEEDIVTIRQRKLQAQHMADEMQAQDVDGSSLGEVMDLIDLLDAAEKALAAVGEQAEAVASGVARRHGGLAEAHASAPVQAAHRDFYGE